MKKLSSSYQLPMAPKVHGRVNICAHRKFIKPCNFRKCFGGFLWGMICSCAPMFKFFSVPPDGASNFKRRFSDFLRTYYCDLLNNMYSYRSFSVVIMGNGKRKHVLPVLHCLKRGIAFVSSFFVFFLNYIQIELVFCVCNLCFWLLQFGYL